MFEYMQPKDGPVVEGLEGLELVFAATQPEYNPLRCLRGKGQTVNVISRWSPTPEQRKAIAEGADILLELFTFGKPLQPIRMMVTDGNLNTDWVRVCLLDMPAAEKDCEHNYATLTGANAADCPLCAQLPGDQAK